MGLIRVVLALSVVIWHLGDPNHHIVNGYLAVICFFIISGFYMSMVINDRYQHLPHYKASFYISRALRLYPTYLFIFFLSLAYWLAIGTSFGKILNVDIASAWVIPVIMTNIVIFGLDLVSFVNVTFVPEGFMRMVGPAWSLGIELQFYAVAPFIVTRSIKWILLILAASITLRLALLGHKYDPWRYYFAPADWCFFMLGHVGHRLSKFGPAREVVRRRIGAGCLLAICLVSGPVGLFGDGELDTWRLWFFYILFAGSLPYIFEMTRYSAVDAVLGNLSYPIYLVHPLIFVILLHLLGKPSAIYRAFGGLYVFGPVWCGVAVLIVIIAAEALHQAIDRPIDRLRNRVKLQPTAFQAQAVEPTQSNARPL